MPRLPRLQLSSIWQQRSFRNLWLGTTVSAFGSEISGIAIPLTAVLLLGATSAQMGVLRAVGTCPALLFGFVAGVWIDRLRRRPILIVADIGRALLLAMLPLAAIFDSLHLPLLYLIAFTTGTLTIFFDIAYLSFVPSLVRNDDLLEARHGAEEGGAAEDRRSQPQPARAAPFQQPVDREAARARRQEAAGQRE